MPPRYETAARMLVGPLGGEAKVVRASGPLAETYARLATTRRLLDATAGRIGVRPADVEVQAETNAVTRLLTLRVRSADARVARTVRQRTRHGARSALAAPERGRGTSRRAWSSSSRAADGGRRMGIAPLAVAALAGLAGLLIAALLAILFDRTDDAITSPEDVEAATGMPCVGVLTRGAMRAARAGDGAFEAGSATSAAAQFGVLAAKLGAERGHSLLLISLHGDPSAVARSLAAALTCQGARVALVDVGAQNGATPDGSAVNGSAVRSAEGELHDLGCDADVVVLHAARPERSPTTLTWARAAGGTVLVAERTRTMAQDLRSTTDTLRLVGAPIVGTVLADPPGPLGG